MHLKIGFVLVMGMIDSGSVNCILYKIVESVLRTVPTLLCCCHLSFIFYLLFFSH